MSLVIKPGFYKTRDGRKAHVFGIRPDECKYPVVGYVEGSQIAYEWRLDGSASFNSPENCDLVEEWKEPRKFPVHAYYNRKTDHIYLSGPKRNDLNGYMDYEYIASGYLTEGVFEVKE